MKDPAFLFYSLAFYEGTRTMLPKERACYIDLLIYQHQNGAIPNDPERVVLYCNGIDQATLEATLKAKFELTQEGWLNKRLEQVMIDREEFTKQASENGKAGQFWKKTYKLLKKSEIQKLKKVVTNDLIISLYDTIDFTNKDTLEATLKQGLSIYNITIKDTIENKDIVYKERKEGTGREENKTDKSERKPKVDKYPYDQIIFLYHEICTSLPRVEVLSDKRKSAIASCLDKAKPEHLEDYVRGYFQKIQASDFLCGNKTDFRASFDFIFKLSNFYKILEGNYDNINNTNNPNGTNWNSQAGRQDRVNSRLEDLRILAEQRARRNGNSSAFN